MILFTLRCSAGHEFEAWFRDGAAYEAQAAADEVACPECGETTVVKAPMAPSVARTRAEPSPAEVRRALQTLRRHVETNCDYVGDKFAEEARKIHKGESERKGIYGEATAEESRELAEEGIEVARIPWVPPNDA